MDKVMHDSPRIHVLGMRLFRRPMKNTDMVTYAEAKKLALAVLYDVEYRGWRSNQIEKTATA
jgi:hypothetical protein